jgi:hypothetical protein
MRRRWAAGNFPITVRLHEPRMFRAWRLALVVRFVFITVASHQGGTSAKSRAPLARLMRFCATVSLAPAQASSSASAAMGRRLHRGHQKVLHFPKRRLK